MLTIRSATEARAGSVPSLDQEPPVLQLRAQSGFEDRRVADGFNPARAKLNPWLVENRRVALVLFSEGKPDYTQVVHKEVPCPLPAMVGRRPH